MSTMGNHSIKLRLLSLVLAFVMTFTALFQLDGMVYVSAADRYDVAYTATSSDAEKNGLVQDGEYYRYYQDGEPVPGGAWIEDGNLAISTDENGYVTMIYNKDTAYLCIYEKLIETAACNVAVKLYDDSLYLFDEEGIKVTASGWHTVATGTYFVSEAGYITKKLTRSGDTIRIYGDSTGKGNWTLFKSTWMTVKDVRYYLNGSGVATKAYFVETRILKLLVNGKFVKVNKKIVKLNDGKDYVFDSYGKRIIKSGWYVTADNINVFVGSNGNAVKKVVRQGSVYKYYKFNGTKKLWVVAGNGWVRTATRLYYVTSTGSCTTIYDGASKKLYRYSTTGKKYITAKNELSKLDGTKYYFFNENGIKVTSNGWKTATPYTKYYVSTNGYVTAKFTDKDGIKKYYEYSYNKNTWIQKKNCWKMVGMYMFYFNIKGIATVSYHTDDLKGYKYVDGSWKLIRSRIQKINSANFYFNGKGIRVKKVGAYKTADGYIAYVNNKGVVYKKEYNLEVKRYYTIDLGNGKKERVYGYYDLKAAKNLMKLVNEHRAANGLSALSASNSLNETATTRAKEVSHTYGHYRPNGTLCINSMYELYGENLACGFSDESLVFRAWSKSTAHDSNMLNTTYKTMGAAVFIALKNDKEGFKKYYVITFGK